MYCCAAKMPMNTGRSYKLPVLRTSAGARLTVTWLAGQGQFRFLMALRTRSLLSFTAESGRPTMANLGRPPLMWVSTVTG